MTFTNGSIGWLATAILALGACAIESPEAAGVDDSTSSTQQAGFFNHFDWCEWFGWYGDGERCDAFCPKPDPDCEPDGELCGGLAGAPCGEDEYCDYEPDSACLTPDATGTCAPRPDFCTAIYDPVCGCDGRTYGNACEARGAGTEVASEGPCDGGGGDLCASDDECAAGERCTAGEEDCLPPPGCDPGDPCPAVCYGYCVPDDGGDDLCGGLGGAACGEDQWCDYEGTTCGAADQMGTCEPIPDSCFDVYDPVCGCDDVTYSNECFAHMAGVDISSEGECAPTPTCADSCGGQSPAGCWCDARCTYFGDCCPDITTACP